MLCVFRKEDVELVIPGFVVLWRDDKKGCHGVVTLIKKKMSYYQLLKFDKVGEGVCYSRHHFRAFRHC